MQIEDIIRNSEIGTILYYKRQRLVKINETYFANENIMLKTENIIETIKNVNKIVQPVNTKIMIF